jgi:DNA primase
MIEHALAPSVRAAILAHYERAVDLIAANFPLAPVIPIYYPRGLDQDPQYGGSVHEPLPKIIRWVEITGQPQPRRYVAADANALRWLVHRGAVGFGTWTPSARDPERVGFARILLSPRRGASARQVASAMVAVRDVLRARRFDAIPVLEANGGALFIPLGDAPAYADVRAWLHDVAEAAVAGNATLLTADAQDHRRKRVHVNVGSNAVGRFSSVPYAIVGSPDLAMVTPLDWAELGVIGHRHFTAENSADRLAQGDVFHRLAAELAAQRFADAKSWPMSDRARHAREAQRSAAADTFRGQIIALLGDGKPRDSQTIFDEGRKKGLFTQATTQRTIYENMLLYMQQEAANGRKAAVVEDPISRKFRINRPVDDWPEVVLAPRPRYIDAAAFDAISSRLRTTAVGRDSTAFEVAVCDAFALFGFVSRHVGGLYAPDGILDAPLGPLAYRAILECKSTPHVKFVSQPRPEEAAKFRKAANADFAVLVGPVLHPGPSFALEIETHAISVWTVDDIITALRLDVDTYECRDLFAPGFVYDRLTDLEWNRHHGPEKRAAVVRHILRREGYAAQCTMVGEVPASDAPVLSLDAAMLLVETALRREGATAGATRDEVHAAMEDLTRSGEAIQIPNRDGIVILRA